LTHQIEVLFWRESKDYNQAMNLPAASGRGIKNHNKERVKELKIEMLHLIIT